MVLKITPAFDTSADLVLFEGDSLDLLPTIPDETISMVVTSPPYNLGKPYETRLEINDYLSQQRKIISECVRILKNNGSICWEVGNYVNDGEIIPLDILLYPIFKSFGLQLRNRIVWHFEHGLHNTKRFSGRYEVILWFTKSDNYYFNLDPVRVPQKYPNKKYFKGPKKGELSSNPLGKNPSDVWIIPNVKSNHVEKTIHPCQFPVELIERLVLSLTKPGDWVLDPFAGVGTTGIASLIHERKAVCAEIMHKYIEIAKERFNQAEEGKLRIRPMERPVYTPDGTSLVIPPKVIRLKSQPHPKLFEKREEYHAKGEQQDEDCV